MSGTQPSYRPKAIGSIYRIGLGQRGGEATRNPILFDHTGDGIKQGTGWVRPDDGFLVLDRNGNGSIDNGTELFGDSTPLYTGGKAAY